MRFFNRKHAEAMLQWKKNIVTKSKFLVSHSLCPYYRYLEERCKDLHRLGRIKNLFCLGAVVMIRVIENSPAIKFLKKKTWWYTRSYFFIFILSELLLTSGYIAQTLEYCQFLLSNLVLFFLTFSSVKLLFIASNLK